MRKVGDVLDLSAVRYLLVARLRHSRAMQEVS
jgi:hypothetical protein